MRFIYIHGLNSSNETPNINLLGEHLDNLVAYSMPNNPVDWKEIIEYEINKYPNDDFTLIGSSTGGFFARYFAEKYGFNAVLINPVVEAETFRSCVGNNTNYVTGEKWYFSGDDVTSLKPLEVVGGCAPTLVFLGSEDSVIDHKETVALLESFAEINIAKKEHRYFLETDEINKIKEMEWVMPLC